MRGVRYFVDFDSGERVEVYDGLDAIRRLDSAHPGRLLLQVDGGPLQTVGWWGVTGYERNPAFVSYGDDGVTQNSAEDR